MINQRRRHYVPMLAFMVCAVTAHAQEYSFQYYGVDQGLTDLAVRSLFQDSKGYLWLSTENGIFRYDGARFRSYGKDDGIPASNGVVFGEAPDGSLLAGGKIGLYRLVENQFQPLPLPEGTTVTWGSGIRPDGNGRSFIATEAGLMRMTWAGGSSPLRIELMPSPPHQGGPGAYGILAEKGSVWWGCGFDLCVAEDGKTRVVDSALGPSPTYWKGIVRAGNGDLWAQTKLGVVAVIRRGKNALEASDLSLSHFGPKGLLSVDKRGRVMVPVGDGLLIQEDGHWNHIDRSSGLHGPVYAILEDREGSIWLGLSGHGLARWLGYPEWSHFNTDSGLGSDLVYEVLPVAGGDIWAGTDSGLFLGRNEGGRWNWGKQTALGDIPIHSIRPDPQGRFWLGTEARGAARFDPRTGKVEWFGKSRGLTAESPYTLMLDHQDRIWAASLSGLFVADVKTLQFQRVNEVPAALSVAVVETPDGEIWVGSVQGLFRLVGKQWRRYTSKDGLSHDEVISLLVDNNGDILAGYQFAREIDRIRRSGSGVRVTRARTAPGDSKGTTYFLGFDAGHRLWAGTNRGVDIQDGDAWLHYDQHDGLVWDDCDLNGFASAPDGTVWIGTSGGLAHFTPGDETPWKSPPVAIIAALTLGKIRVDPAQKISVPYNANALAVSYSALTFVRESAVTFRYRLAPLSGEWRETRERQLQFPGLPPGAYSLEIQARDGWNRWSSQSTTFSFVIRPPWWRSWWFLSLLTAACLGTVALVIRRRSYAAKHRERELVYLVEERTKELEQANDGLQEVSSQLQKANLELSHLSATDALTGAANRRMFDQTLEKEWERARRMGTPLSLILADIDHFKSLNDALGHQKGDECLKLVAAELAKVGKRATDLVARIGGEEFAMLLPATDPLQAMELAEKARSCVEKLGIWHPNLPAGASVTISLGIAPATGNLFPDAEALVGGADRALYDAKHAGRNRAVLFKPGLASVSDVENHVAEPVNLVD